MLTLYSYTKIRDGNDSASVLLNQLTGTTAPQYILSSTTAMFLIFTSDAVNVLDGYSVTWESKLSMCNCLVVVMYHLFCYKTV